MRLSPTVLPVFFGDINTTVPTKKKIHFDILPTTNPASSFKSTKVDVLAPRTTARYIRTLRNCSRLTLDARYSLPLEIKLVQVSGSVGIGTEDTKCMSGAVSPSKCVADESSASFLLIGKKISGWARPPVGGSPFPCDPPGDGS
jgi:hypothetical protein